MINILHLSDLHLSENNDNRRDQTLKTFKEDLVKFFNEPQNNQWLPNFVVISGDLTFTGSAKEFTKVEELIIDWKKVFNIGDTNIIVTPGNHDKFRRDSEIKIVEMFDGNSGIKDLKSTISIYQENIEKKLIKDSDRVDIFSNYNSFARNLKLKMSEKLAVKGWDPDFDKTQGAYFYQLESGVDIVFVTINSSYYCLGGELDYGRLKLDAAFIEEVDKKIIQIKQSMDRRVIVVSVMHHNPSWFKWEDKLSLPDAPATYSKITSFSDLILSGHEHSVKYFPDFLNFSAHSIIGGATYTNEKKDKFYSNNFSIIQIDEKEFTFKRKNFVFSSDEGRLKNWSDYDNGKKYPIVSICPNEYERVKEEKGELLRENNILKGIVFKKEEFTDKNVDMNVPFQLYLKGGVDEELFKKLLGIENLEVVFLGSEREKFYVYKESIYIKKVKSVERREIRVFREIIESQFFIDKKMLLIVEKIDGGKFDLLKDLDIFVMNDKLQIINVKIIC